VYQPGIAKRIRSIYETGIDPSIKQGAKEVPGTPEAMTRWRLYQAMTWVSSRTRDLQMQARLAKGAETVMSGSFRN
jgi:hypothetical protein